MDIVELAVVLWIAVIGPILDYKSVRLLKNSRNPRRRLYAYWLTILSSLVLTILVWPSLGATILASPFGKPATSVQIAACCLIALLILGIVQPLLLIRKSSEHRVAVHKAFAALDFVLPTNKIERFWFIPLVVSAGIFEEILFRNFLIQYFGFLPICGAILASASIFGFAHIYQGWKAALVTLVFALIFTVVVAGTGSLIAAMAVHAIWDIRVLLFMMPSDHELLSANSTHSPARPSSCR